VAAFFSALLYAGQSSLVAHDEMIIAMATNKRITEIVFFIMISILSGFGVICMRRSVPEFCKLQRQ